MRSRARFGTRDGRVGMAPQRAARPGGASCARWACELDRRAAAMLQVGLKVQLGGDYVRETVSGGSAAASWRATNRKRRRYHRGPAYLRARGSTLLARVPPFRG